MSITMRRLDLLGLAGLLPDLIALLRDAVESGASIGFVQPVNTAELLHYWLSVIDEVRGHAKIVLVSEDQEGLVGSVQMTLEKRANGNHRAEVQKLMVHRQARRQGIAQQLMVKIEEIAREEKRSLLILDTRSSDAAEQLYLKLGYLHVGTIPQYARNPEDGALEATVFMYKILEDA